MNGGKRDPTRAHSVGTRLDFTRDALGGSATFKRGSMNWRRARRAAAENGLCWTGVLPGEFLAHRACRFREVSGVDAQAPLRPRAPYENSHAWYGVDRVTSWGGRNRIAWPLFINPPSKHSAIKRDAQDCRVVTCRTLLFGDEGSSTRRSPVPGLISREVPACTGQLYR